MARFRLRLKDREIALPESGELVVGRESTCDISIDDRLASRRHAAFRASADGELEVVDLASLNGLRVNDAVVKGTRPLGHRDRVQIGGHVFVVLDQRRERRSNAPTTQSTPMRAAATRPVQRAARAAPTALDTIADALESGDVGTAASAMDAVVARYADGSEPVGSGELARVTLLLLSMAERTGEARFFDRVFQIHSARRMVLEPSAIDAIQAALPRLPVAGASAIDTYLDVMGASAAVLSTQEQVRLRRVATVARRLGRGTSS